MKKEVKNKNAKKPKTKMTKKAKIILASVLAGIAFLTASLFVVDSFAPASPVPYHQFVISTFAGSVDAKDKPNSYYQVQIQKEVSGDKTEYSCINTRVQTEGGINGQANIREIWISFSDLYENEINIFLSTGWQGKSRFLSERTYSKADVRRNKTGWFKVFSSGGEGFNHDVHDGHMVNHEIRFGFSASVKVREIVVVDVNGVVGTVTVPKDRGAGCSYGPRPIKGQNNDYSATHTSKFYPDDLKNICDEKSVVCHTVDGKNNVFKI